MNDDTLILYYYDDGLSDDERAGVEAALEYDASLRERYRALCRSLDRFNDPPAERAPAQVAVSRWHRSIEHAAAGERAGSASTGRGWHFPSFAWGALAASLVAAAVAIGLYFGDQATPVPSIADSADSLGIDEGSPGQVTTPVSFSRGLQVHLRESREDIMRLAANGNGDRTMLVMNIVRQNRLFERAARQHDAEDVARVLRAFEPVLLRLASEDTSADDAAALRAKLGFELKVILTKMEQSESDDTDSI
jgi:hypothetical protein